MDTEIDWQRELDASFGSGRDADVEHYVATGRRAVRRRRAAAVVAGLVAVVAVAGGTWTVVRDGPSNGESHTAGDVRGVDDPSPTARPWHPGEMPARVGPGADDAEIRPGAVVHERRDNLFPDRGTRSVALDLTYGGERWWIFLEWSDEGYSGGAGDHPDEGTYATFDAFVRGEVSQGGIFFVPGHPVFGEDAPTDEER